MDEFEDDLTLAETADTLEHQLAFQEQMGGNLTAQEPGRIELTLNPYVDRVSKRKGVQEPQFTANLRQHGQFIERQNLIAELSEAIYHTLQILPSLHNRTHSKVEAWARWSARPKICLIATVSLQQNG